MAISHSLLVWVTIPVTWIANVSALGCRRQGRNYCLSSKSSTVGADQNQTSAFTDATGRVRSQTNKEPHMSATTEQPAGAPAIRPFQVDIPDEALDDLRRRVAATNWPEKETVADQSQGVPLAITQ